MTLFICLLHLKDREGINTRGWKNAFHQEVGIIPKEMEKQE